MRYYGKRLLLSILHSLIYLKRFFVWIGMRAGRVLGIGVRAYQGTIGLWLYKGLFFLKKRWGGSLHLPGPRMLEFAGKRGTLQFVFLIIGIVLMIPETRLFTASSTGIAGRDTLLYQLVGPGEQDFSLEEITVDDGMFRDDINIPGWREGSLSADQLAAPGGEFSPEFEDLSSISVDGTAVTKPTILPGAELPVEDSASDVEKTGRTKIVRYAVKPGDTIGAIAEAHGVTVATILWANNLSIRSYIRPGDTLDILPVDGVIHKVKSGENVTKIAKTYDTTPDKIIAFNRLQKEGADIIIGEELIIPDGKKPAPIAPARTIAGSALRKITAPPPSITAPAGSGYIWPTNVRRVTQYFGWRHTGIDIAGSAGTPLYAAKSGRVIKSQCGWNGGYGCYIIIDHGNGVHTLYGHNSQLYVSVGDDVEQGQAIAAMGSTGRSTGPHIHFEVRVGGRRANPLQYVR